MKKKIILIKKMRLKRKVKIMINLKIILLKTMKKLMILIILKL